LSYCFYDPKRYFRDMLNYWNWFVIISHLVYQFVLWTDPDKEISIVFDLVILMAIFYKGFNFLRLFDAFAPFVGIFNSVVGNH
jgi:hypothetical protein